MVDVDAPRILVMGGGKQGKIIAEDLAEDFYVDIADIKQPDTNIRWVKADLSDVSDLINLTSKYELVVNALPSKIGGNASYIAATMGVCLVDLSFHDMAPEKLERAVQMAKRDRAQIVIIDAGFAPGITDLIVGRECLGDMYTRTTKDVQGVKIYAGGVAHNRNMPYGHVNTWSLQDMEKEYKQEARYIEKSEQRTAMPLLYPLETTQVQGYTMEAFITDGLRSLLHIDSIPNMVEKTLRWPGHIENVTPLIEDGTFVKTLDEKCNEGRDMVMLKICIEGPSGIAASEFSLVHYGTAEMSAMTRLTAYSCAAFTRAIFNRKVGFNSRDKFDSADWDLLSLGSNKGFFRPSALGTKLDTAEFILDYLSKKGIDVSGLRPPKSKEK